MAKEKPRDPDEEARRLAKAERKAKRSETDGVHKAKPDKKDRKEKKLAVAASEVEVATKLLNTVEDMEPRSVVIEEQDGDVKVKPKTAPLLGALVPFANPLADEKVGKKVLKSVKKAAKNKSLKRGVKEVVKSLRKSSTSAVSGGEPPGIVILAADISPMDVISHIPVLCEDHGVPYIFVTSRAELGAASSTARPTSVAMVSKEAAGKKKDGEKGQSKEGEEDFAEVYKDLLKVVMKASRDVRI